MSLILVIFHVITGTIGVASGATALWAKKGSILHRRAGRVFFSVMLCLSLSGVVLAMINPMMISVIAGLFTVYLVMTSMMAIKTPEKALHRYEYLSPIFALILVVLSCYYGYEASITENRLKDGYPAENYYFFAVLSLVSMLLDIRVLVSKGLLSAHRLARHLWRMCFAFYIAIGSLFSQGAKALPDFVRESALISIPENVVLIVMFFWLGKTYYTYYKNR